MLRRYLLALGGVALLAAPAAAQDSLRDTLRIDEMPDRVGRSPFQITPSIGVMRMDEASALRRTAGVLGLDFIYRLNSNFGVGLTGSVARPQTDGEYFPLVRLAAGDTSLYFRVSQHVVQYTYGVQGVATARYGRFAPYATGSIGRYLFTMDPQAVEGVKRYGGPMFSIGGGINLPLGNRAGMSIDVRDVVFASFERNEFDATDPLLRDDRFDPIPAGKPAPKSAVHNLRLSIGVSFIPDSREGTP